MKRLAITTALAVFLAGACTTTHQVKRPSSLADLDATMPRQRGRVTLLHAQPAGVVSPLPPALAPLEGTPVPETGGSLLVVSNLTGYDVKNRGRGALEGMGLGMLVGAVAGMAIGVASGDDKPCTNDDGGCVMITGSFLGAMFAVIGALAGSAVGSLVGFGVGHTNRYVFTDGTPAP